MPNFKSTEWYLTYRCAKSRKDKFQEEENGNRKEGKRFEWKG